MPTQQIIPTSSDPNVSFIYRIEVDGFKHYEPNIALYLRRLRGCHSRKLLKAMLVMMVILYEL